MKEYIKSLKERSGTTPIYIAKIARELGRKEFYCQTCNVTCNKKDCYVYDGILQLKKELYTYTGEIF